MRSIATSAGKVVGYLAIAVLWLAWSGFAFGQEWLMFSSYGSPSFRTTFSTGSSVDGTLTTNRLGSMTFTNVNLNFRSSFLESPISVTGTLSTQRLGSTTFTNVNLNFRSSFLEPSISVTGTLSTQRLGSTTFTNVNLQFRSTFSKPSSSLTGTLSTHRLGTMTFTDVNLRLRPSPFGVTSNNTPLTITGSSLSRSSESTTSIDSTLRFKQPPF